MATAATTFSLLLNGLLISGDCTVATPMLYTGEDRCSDGQHMFVIRNDQLYSINDILVTYARIDMSHDDIYDNGQEAPIYILTVNTTIGTRTFTYSGEPMQLCRTMECFGDTTILRIIRGGELAMDSRMRCDNKISEVGGHADCAKFTCALSLMPDRSGYKQRIEYTDGRVSCICVDSPPLYRTLEIIAGGITTVSSYTYEPKDKLRAKNIVGEVTRSNSM